jgi:NAD-dependent deacetylase
LLRPDVVWFGEALHGATIEAAYRAAQRCDVFFSVGTSALVHPAATLPYIALESGALTVEVNPAKTPLSANADYILHYGAGEALPLLVEAAWPDVVADT